MENKDKINKLIDQNILYNASELVGYLEANEAFSWGEDVSNALLSFNPSHEGRCDYCDKTKTLTDNHTCENTCDECYYDNCDYREVLKWWVVTDWFAEKLDLIGEPVLSILGMRFWGRTTSGQHISMDGVIERVLERIEVELTQ